MESTDDDWLEKNARKECKYCYMPMNKEASVFPSCGRAQDKMLTVGNVGHGAFYQILISVLALLVSAAFFVHSWSKLQETKWIREETDTIREEAKAAKTAAEQAITAAQKAL